MPDLVLHLGRESELALERRRPQDPLALGEHAHDLRVAVHLDELDERLAIGVRHRVARLDLATLLDVRFEFFLAQRLEHRFTNQTIVRVGIYHDSSPRAPRTSRRPRRSASPCGPTCASSPNSSRWRQCSSRNGSTWKRNAWTRSSPSAGVTRSAFALSSARAGSWASSGRIWTRTSPP